MFFLIDPAQVHCLVSMVGDNRKCRRGEDGFLRLALTLAGSGRIAEILAVAGLRRVSDFCRTARIFLRSLWGACTMPLFSYFLRLAPGCCRSPSMRQSSLSHLATCWRATPAGEQE